MTRNMAASLAVMSWIASALMLQVSCFNALPYVDKSNPYKLGRLGNSSFTLSKSDGAVLHTTVIHPTEAGEYPLFYFIPGGPDGVIPAEWYRDVLTRVVSHGLIVAAVDAFYPLIDLPMNHPGFQSLNSQNTLHLEWLKQNLQKHLGTSTKVMVNNTALGCHSAGCDTTLQMIQNSTSIVNSTVFLEPFSLNIKKKPDLKIPAYMYGTQLSEELSPCSLPGVDYKAFYQQWGCPKWMTEIAGFGHCDILDHLWWETCHYGHFCKTVGNWSRVFPAYHEYVSGAISAFLIGTLQQYTPAFQYIQNQTLIPQQMLSLNHTSAC